MKERKYDKWDEDRVKEVDIRDVIPGCKHNKLSQEVTCPFCGEKKFGVNARRGANYARCFKCGEGFSNPIAAVMHYESLDYLPALERTAQIGNVILTPQAEKRAAAVTTESSTLARSFCQEQLQSSGLSEEDVIAHVYDGSQELWLSPFRKGKLTENFVVDSVGDEMLIYYYDLEGRPMTYNAKGSKHRQYVRVRWSNPALHKGKDGKEMKYQTPEGASSKVYIPEKIRRLYQSSTHIDTLYLQEGEKKAEKACKHGILSVGIQGINNFGNKEEGLLQDIQDIAKRCSISNIVLLMDADWNDLHKHIVIGDRADRRPNSFSKAVIKFKQYMKTFHTLGLSVDIWWGHVNTNERGDKGIDDLLNGTLKGKEDTLVADLERAMHSHDGRGVYANIHKITAESDEKIRDYWSLNDVQKFYQLHKSRLEEIDTFKIGNIRYKKDGDGIVAMSRYSSAVDIYTITQTQKGEDRVEFNDVEAFRFLAASGFHRMRLGEGGAIGYDYIRIDDGIIDRIAPYEVRDYIRDYITANCKSEMVLQFFAKKLSTIMADKQLENLSIINDDFTKYEKGVQRLYYNNGAVEISAHGIVANKPMTQVWRTSINARKFERVPIIKRISKESERYNIEYSPAAEECEFLRYLSNTSNNAYGYGEDRELSEAEMGEWIHHLVNKITTLGYLLTDYKYPSERRAVVVQDHKISEVGQSSGGAGKSILGAAIGHVKRQYFIDGKNANMADPFLLSGVTKHTRSIFFDDVHTNFDFGKLFNLVTGPMPINPKGKDRYIISVDESPKIIINTNHAINRASEGSYKRRISYMEFSSWYNSQHMPIDDFHHQLFDEWDDEQWNLFDNLMAECVMYYLQSMEQTWEREGQGVVQPPMRNIELRTLRQEIGETLLSWAEEYYDPSGPHLNAKEGRKEVWEAFEQYAGNAKGFGVTPSNFRKKIEKYCKYKGWDFNPDVKNEEKMYMQEWKARHPGESFIGGDHKSNSKEWLTVWWTDKPAGPF